MAPKRTRRADVAGREQTLRDLQRHLAIPDTGGEASLTVVVDGVRLEVTVRATKILAGAELADVRGYFNAAMAESPWRIGRGKCGSTTTKKSSPWSSRPGTCSKPITGAVIYQVMDFAAGKPFNKVRVSFHCAHHEHTHGIEPHNILGVLPVTKADVRHYLKKLEEHNAAQRPSLAGGVT